MQGNQRMCWLIGLLLLFSNTLVYGDDSFPTPGALSFRDKEMDVKPGDLVSNVVRIINTTGRSGEFTLSLQAPGGWQVVGTAQRSFSMSAGDTLFLPVRIVARARIQDDRPVSIDARLIQFGNILASDTWAVTPVLHSSWSASVSPNRIILPSDSDTASVKLHVRNRGDRTELYTLGLLAGSAIDVINKEGDKVAGREQHFSLKPATDTIFAFRVKVKPQDTSPGERLPGDIPMRLRLELNSESHAGARGRSWGNNIEIRRVEQQWSENPSPFYTLPLTIDFNAYNVLDENAYGNLALYGHHIFNEETRLSYYFQSNFVSNYLNPQAYLGQYLQLNFQSRFFDVELGNITHNIEGANISGEGVKVTGKYENHRLSTTVTQSPGLFDDPIHVRGAAAEYRYLGREFRGGAYLQLRDNEHLKTDEEIAGAQASYRFMGTQFARVSVSASRQTHNWKPDSVFDLTGLGYTFNYGGSLTNLSYNLHYANHTPTHLVRRGSESISSRVSWRINRQHSLLGTFSQHTSNPEHYFRGEFRETNAYRFRQIYRLGYQYRGGFSDVSFQPTHQRFEDPFLRHTISGVEMDYRVRNFHDIRFFSNALAGYTQLPDQEVDPFFVARIRAGVRYLQYSLNLRYYFGPYYGNELRRFANDRISSNRFGASLNFDNYLLNDALLFRMSGIYNYTTYNEQHMGSLRPEVFYFPGGGLRFGIYGRYYGLASGDEVVTGLPDIDLEGAAYSSSRFEFGFSLKKDLNLPVSGRRYFDLTIMVYRDVSGTGDWQSNDPGLKDMWVRLQAIDVADDSGSMVIRRDGIYEALTGRDGKALFNNISPGNYMATIVPVSDAGSRFESRTYEIMVSQSQTVYLSIDRGARVAGSIILERDPYTRAEYFPLGGIRVTATNEEGQEFSTLSGEGGQYSLYLPKGKYSIAVNENIFGETFDLLQNNVPVEVMHEQEVITVNFTAKERTREIRIQQPENNDD